MAVRTMSTAASAAATAAKTPSWAVEVCNFWFQDLKPSDWFGMTGGPALDEKIKERFMPLYRQLAAKTPEEALVNNTAALATVITLDQFPRNMFRKLPEAFATDHAALAVSKNAVATGLDKDLSFNQKMFLYMPYMHSENLDDQHTALELFTALGEGNEKAVDFCQQHLDIIKQFGRFPHRNGCLGRTSTPEEIAFAAKSDGFGQ